MGTSEKIMHYANFNITYGPTEDPMLTHFEDIIWPAFLSDFKRGKKNEHPLFYLSDIALKEISGDMVLVGNLYFFCILLISGLQAYHLFYAIAYLLIFA